MRGWCLAVALGPLLHVVPARLAYAHQDLIIELNRDGSLHGLPAKYEPASLVIPAGDYHEGQNVVLQLANHRVEFPECLSVLFAKASRRHIQLSASWYHDPTTLPYYLSIELPLRRRSGQGFFDGWSLLVALDTGELIEVNAVFESDDGMTQRGQKIDVAQFCTADEVEQLKPKQITPGASQP